MINQYDGKTDLDEHVDVYVTQMTIYNGRRPHVSSIPFLIKRWDPQLVYQNFNPIQ